ncbi:asialoglycoprotein receptor 1-like isoform X1 [Daphnia magna]|uniref:asialoglycoprotein receptor 1-like isoform X1 n=1 Tax=Daphnia magna TaxID=35525 RepID=UPI001E1BB092|nr:asialoglycoprotein receptor 1-like isoform X1 [Daphnia magna]
MVNIIPIFVILLSTLLISSHGNAVESHLCGGRVFVENTIVIEAPVHEDCHWDIQTQEDRILVITALSGNLKEAQEFLAIHDGSGKDSPILIVENQKTHERSRKDLPEAVYTTQSTANIRFKKAPTSNLQLKIQKAVDCPFNLGMESQCGRIIDDVSCYCATFSKRNHASQTTYCTDHNMKLLTVESYEKEQAIYAAWGKPGFWTSLTDAQQEGQWIWESTGTSLYPGYENWCPGEPSSGEPNEDCMLLQDQWGGCWNDGGCGFTTDAICQAIP